MSRPKVKLTDEHINQINEYFSLLDDDHDGELNPPQVAILFRSLGQTISDSQLNHKIEGFISRKQDELKKKLSNPSNESQNDFKIKRGASGRSLDLKRSYSKTFSKRSKTEDGQGFTSEDFVNFFIECYKKPTTIELLIEAFQVFDENRVGFITSERLVELLTRRGEPLNNSEIEEVLSLAGGKSKGSVDYASLAETLIKGPQNIRSV